MGRVRARHLQSAYIIITALWLLSVVQRVEAQSNLITPPPRESRPVVANGMIYYLDYIPKKCQTPVIAKLPGGGKITNKRAFVKADNPHEITGNIEIAPSGCLYIEPGVVMKFAPGVGMIINGTLIARGSEEPGGRITMTKMSGNDTGGPSGDWQDDARLSLGNTTQDGRLDLLYKNRWRAICTNYNNFTKIDANVTCRHLGFLKGNFTYHSYARNLTDYILWEKPGCLGSENSLFDCPGVYSIRTGRHICDGQEVVGFTCEGLRPGLALDHWRGLDFYNSTIEQRWKPGSQRTMRLDESQSFLEYLDISYTGLDITHGRTSEPNVFYQKAAISASPHVPMMNNVTVRYGAYDALNATEILSPIHIANCTFSGNRGYGLFIQSSVGRTLINQTEVSHNWGDGIKFYISNLTIFDFRTKFPPEKSFCVLTDATGQAFPFFRHMDLIQVNGDERTSKAVGGYCQRVYRTKDNMRITIHFLILERDPLAKGYLLLRDGSSLATPTVVDIYNGSFPQSYTTKSNTLYVRFNYSIPMNRICPDFAPCIRFLFEVTTDYDVDEEFHLLMSSVHNNIGHGVSVQDLRSKMRVNNGTYIADNGFGAGVRVYKGAGDIIINGTQIERNADAGVNITYSGGYQLFNESSFNENKGYGVITEYLKFNRTRLENQNKVEVVSTTFSWNELIALRMGNYCQGGSVKVNESQFAYNYDEAFEYLSCNVSTMFSRKVNIEFNTFKDNFRHGILMRPLLNTHGIITNNTFSGHTLGALRFDNGYDLLISRWYRDFPVKFDIFENTFSDNSGRYAANFRLTEYSAVQQVDIKFNRFENNVYNNSFKYLNPRSRANAVVVLSCSNALFQRNFMYNPASLREVATHLVDPSITINAQENYWGMEINNQADYERIHQAVFDQDDRYNLAKVNFYPALKTSRLYDNFVSSDVPAFVWSFKRPGNLLGGVLLDSVVIRRGETFFVDKDIYIVKDKILKLEPGSTLKFASSVGMVVHGILTADGKSTQTPINFQLDDSEEFVPMENRTASVRLVDGLTEFEGRLEVQLDGQWGTVCNHGWIEENSLLACQQLGLTFNLNSPTARQQIRASEATPILMNWVSCDDVDTDLTQCRSVNEDARSCDHGNDVYLRCQPPTWAGITLAAAQKKDQVQEKEQTQIRFVDIRNAGLLDPDTATLTPALRIDYNFYQISWLRVEQSVSDGIHISYNQPFDNNVMEFLRVNDNAGNGFVTKSPKLIVRHSKFDSNGKAGFLYDPFFTEYDALLTRNMIYPDRRKFMFDQSLRSQTLGSGNVYTVQMSPDDDHLFLLCRAGLRPEVKEYFVQVTARYRYDKLALQIMDYQPDVAAEKLTVYDSTYATMYGAGVKTWRVEEDLVDFPIVSSGATITLHLSVNGQLSGRLALVVIARGTNVGPAVLATTILNSTFSLNDQGIVTKHYNNPSNKRMEIFHRHKEEEIFLKELVISSSIRHAIHMPSVTKFHEDYIPTYEDMTQPERVARIKYDLLRVTLANNNQGMLAEHNHVDFANNVWQWTMDDVTIQNIGKGGLEIEVPRVNDGTSRERHAVHVMNCHFKDNIDFAFTIAGYYADVKIVNNEFLNNYCAYGLISITGMEKRFEMSGNDIRGNIGRYVVDMNILSHSEDSTQVAGNFSFNQLVGNRYDGVVAQTWDNNPTTFAVALKGLQNVFGYRNLFDNKELGYEFVAGIEALRLASHINFTHNWWGYTDETIIRQRIFDFDDWNNYVIADYWPYLTRDSMSADPARGEPREIFLDPSHLGGRVERSQSLTNLGRPYIVDSDLTVMPGVTLTIPIATELQFRPNVGILVLGRLVAYGLPHGRIKMRPIQPNSLNQGRKRRAVEEDALMAQSNNPGSAVRRSKRNTASAKLRLRGDGTLFKDAGFLELYNASSKSWNLMCDNQFNEETAEVVCRELGKETINVKVRFTELFDYHIYGKPMYFLKEFWFNKYHCRGDEDSLEQCITRYNYNLLSCVIAANYTFITCGERNLEPELQYWGNIRFASDNFEEKPLEDDIGKDRSVLKYVDIEGAGFLHGEKVGAIQTTYVTPEFSDINITKCADNGFDIVAPRRNLNLETQNITGNLGFGVNVLVLNGESSERQSSFLPNGPSTIPYNLYGLVNICTMEKEIFLETRMILYYKYGPNNRDCVKVVSSRKQIGLRFLQINLFQEDFSRNLVEIFEGRDINAPNAHIGSILANSTQGEIQRLYKSRGNTMAIHVHASVSHGSYGFIAEVVRLPPTGLTYPNSEYSHKMEHSAIRANQDGAIQYKSVGETNPSLFIEHCWITQNGYPILNLTSPPTIDLSLQSVISFRFSHNQVSYNKGGMYLFTHTSAINSALRGNLTNNVFAFGTHGEALNISGHYFQRLMLHQNYIYNYTTGDYIDVIHIKGVVTNLTSNYILRNKGHYIINTYDSDDSAESQLFSRNGIYTNNATALRESTIKVGSGRPKITYNYLVNSLNDFEIESYPLNMSMNIPIDAVNNWWGSERRAYISGKTFDNFDDKDLLPVDYWPPILDNRSLIEGHCLPGWVLDKNRCYRYMGGALPYQEAKDFCKSHGAFLAESRSREGFFNFLIRLMVMERDWAQRVWVMSEVGAGHCSAFEVRYIVREEDCARRYYPFICETDPLMAISEELADSIKAMIIGICVGVGGVILIIAVIIVVLWCLKSRHREKERFERTASIRSSLNNLNKINSSLRGTKSTLTMLSEGYSRRRLNELDERSMASSAAKYSHNSAVSHSSVESVQSDYQVDGYPRPANGRDYYMDNPRQTAGRDYNQDSYPRRAAGKAGVENSRPTHSLRPDRSGGPRARMQSRDDERDREGEERMRQRARQLEAEDRERERRRGRRREPSEYSEEDEGNEERGGMEEDSDYSDKKDFDDDDEEYFSESTFDEDEDEEPNERRGADETDARNMQYRVNRSHEHLLEKPPLGASGGRDAPSPGNQPRSRGNMYEPAHKSSSVPSFLHPVQDDLSYRHAMPVRSGSRDNLPTPPPDPRRLQSSPELDKPRPAPRPKPALPTRQVPSHLGSRDRLYNDDKRSDRPLDQQSQASSGRPYKNIPGSDQGSQASSSRPYRNVPGSDLGSQRGPLYDSVYDGQGSQTSSQAYRYDPVHEGSTSSQSRSTNRYEPVEYGFDQVPDTDYMPRPLDTALGKSRERLGPPPPMPPPSSQPQALTLNPPPTFRAPIESDIDSYAPSLQSDVDYLPRKPPSLPRKPGAGPPRPDPYLRGSRDNIDFPQPPPYPGLDVSDTASSRTGSRGLRSSRERLDDAPPPYSPGARPAPPPQRGNVLYLGGRGAKPKNQSVETEI